MKLLNKTLLSTLIITACTTFDLDATQVQSEATTQTKKAECPKLSTSFFLEHKELFKDLPDDKVLGGKVKVADHTWDIRNTKTYEHDVNQEKTFLAVAAKTTTKVVVNMRDYKKDGKRYMLCSYQLAQDASGGRNVASTYLVRELDNTEKPVPYMNSHNY